MGAVRLLRTLAPLALVAILATACGSGSSSSPSSSGTPSDDGPATTSSSFEVRPVFARYSPGVQFGPQVPKDLVDQMSNQSCPMDPATVQGMLMECDAEKTVYLMKDPITSGGVDSAVAKQIGHGKLWYIQVTLDPATAGTLATATKPLTGTDIAYSLDGTVLTSVIVDSSFHSDKLAIIGSFDKAEATKLASRIASS
jgi:hypothetical protein